METVGRYPAAIGCSLWDLVKLLDPDGQPPATDTWKKRMEAVARRVCTEEMANSGKGPDERAGH